MRTLTGCEKAADRPDPTRFAFVLNPAHNQVRTFLGAPLPTERPTHVEREAFTDLACENGACGSGVVVLGPSYQCRSS
jgi:hypothetical protein